MTKLRGGIHWFMLETKDFISSNIFRSKNENGNLVSFNGQSITLRLSIKEIFSFLNEKNINYKLINGKEET